MVEPGLDDVGSGPPDDPHEMPEHPWQVESSSHVQRVNLDPKLLKLQTDLADGHQRDDGMAVPRVAPVRFGESVQHEFGATDSEADDDMKHVHRTPLGLAPSAILCFQPQTRPRARSTYHPVVCSSPSRTRRDPA